MQQTTKYILTILLLFFATHVGKIDAEQNDVFIPRSMLENKEILGMTTEFGLLAVATNGKIHFFTNDEEKRPIGIIVIPYRPRSKILELKMFSKSELFYCDETSCGLCTYSNGNSSCSTIVLPAEHGHSLLEVKSASVVKIESSEQFILCLAYTVQSDEFENEVIRMTTLRYDAQDNGVLQPLMFAEEPTFLIEPTSLIGFQKDQYIYFVITSSQKFEPETILHSGSKEMVTVTKIIRICAEDTSDDLITKMAVLVGCDEEVRNIYSRAEAVTFDSSLNRLGILSRNDITNTYTLCQFKLTNIDKRFKSIWNTCQQTLFTEERKKEFACTYPSVFEEMSKKKECMIFTRKTDAFETKFCSKFGRDETLENCQVHKVESRSYRNGWLEDYTVLKGELMMKIPSNANLVNVTSIMQDGKAYFISVAGKTTEISRISSSNTSDYQLNWKKNVANANKFSIARSPASSLLYLTNLGIQSISISCRNFYKKCEDLENGGFNDPMSCMWCADAPPFLTISGDDKNKCSNILREKCPPNINAIMRYPNNTGLTIHGSQLKGVKNPEIFACNTKCSVSHIDDVLIKCTNQENEEISYDCGEINLVGSIAEKNYSLPYALSRSDHEVQTDPSRISSADERKGSSPGWKVAIAILSVLALIVIVVVLVYFMRNRLSQIKTHVRPPNSQRIENEYDLTLNPGRTSQFALSGDNYVRIFRNLRPDLKIDFDQLEINKNAQMGQGHYGVVYQAFYTSPKAGRFRVVCKYMKEGRISEFYDEARTMSEFDHPKTLKLLGVALDEISHMPIIVTEYMAFGDLRSYISDVSNKITMRILFQFASDIARGMEYIHSKGYIHRDLAARNCMVDSQLNVKVADFGLCRKLDVETQLYTSINERELPIKWFPPEIIDRGFGIPSDIWSFGIVLWELFTRGMMPYDNMSSEFLLNWLRESEENRLSRPVFCPEKLYNEAMKPCWRANPSERPKFYELVTIIDDVVNYIEENDRLKLHSGYERVSIRYPMSSPVHLGSPAESSPLLQSNHNYCNVLAVQKSPSYTEYGYEPMCDFISDPF